MSQTARRPRTTPTPSPPHKRNQVLDPSSAPRQAAKLDNTASDQSKDRGKLPRVSKSLSRTLWTASDGIKSTLSPRLRASAGASAIKLDVPSTSLRSATTI
ncbi:hypothetical protein JCM5350_001940 [Sporobolomyces pararoseus]